MITKETVLEKLKNVEDPELGLDIVHLGLVRNVTLGPEMHDLGTHEWIEILMTLTSPFCPYAEELIASVEEAVEELKDGEPRVEITFDPPWEPSKGLREELGIF